jgi:hypothetical protein
MKWLALLGHEKFITHGVIIAGKGIGQMDWAAHSTSSKVEMHTMSHDTSNTSTGWHLEAGRLPPWR